MSRKIRVFLDGMAYAFDMSGLHHHKKYMEQPEIADADAIASDWQAVYGDFWFAFEEVGSEVRRVAEQQR